MSAPALRDGAGRFAAGVSGNPAGRPRLVRDPRVLGADAKRRAGLLLEWVLWSAVISGAASMSAGAADLLAGADALDEAAMTLRDLARIR